MLAVHKTVQINGEGGVYKNLISTPLPVCRGLDRLKLEVHRFSHSTVAS